MQGVSSREYHSLVESRSLHAILDDPRQLPLKIPQWITGLTSRHAIVLARAPSIVFGILTIVAVMYVLRQWYGPRTALYGFIIFVTSSWFLHVSRMGTFDVLYLWALPTLLASHILLRNHAERRSVLWVWFLAQVVLLYLPGMVWFILLNGLWQRQRIADAWRSASVVIRSSTVFIAFVLLSPLIYSAATNNIVQRLLDIAALPTSLPAPLSVLTNLGNGLAFISVRGTAPDDVWLNNLPVLDAFLSASLLVGIYFYAKHWHASRTQLIGSFFIVGLLLYALGVVPFSIVVPLLYLVAAAGIAYLLYLWLSIFPRNPIARGFGMVLIALAVTMSSIYSLRQYFVAWPHHPETQQAFQERKLPRSGR